MTRHIFIFTVLLLAFIEQLLGQDTTLYSQANASMFSNNYTFIKKDKSDSQGTFQQYCVTDDLQYWYGQGTFTETKRKIYLTFDTANNYNRIETVFNTEHSDTLYIKWFDWCGNQQEWFSVRFADTVKNKTIYRADIFTRCIKIPKIDLKDKKLSLYPFASDRKIFEFVVADSIDYINLFVNDAVFMHSFGKTKETLTKKPDGFVTIGIWTNNKRTRFIKR